MTNAQQQSSIEALISHDEFTGVTTLTAIHKDSEGKEVNRAVVEFKNKTVAEVEAMVIGICNKHDLKQTKRIKVVH